ncbi:iron transporter [Haloprofundus salilacus]|uniref:iron transporter n=1 Tax=Haloprofundus salilacus TaxID=2876190 RepID=UPI001CCFB614|nr:iron transporter [Haloprofundus salilacus]
MRRRTLLGAVGTGLAGSLAGCTSLLDTTTSREPPLVENRPRASYVPTHQEGMKMVGMADAGDLKVGVMYSYAHRFWTVQGQETERIDVGRNDAIHLMVNVWDPESGQVVPATGVTVETSDGDEYREEEVVYEMLSQRMGFHYGDNWPLPGDGTYTLRVDVGGVNLRRFGAFEGKFAEPATAELEFEYSERKRNDIPYTILEEKQGDPGALPVMEMQMPNGMAMPVGRAPEPDSLPGESFGSEMSGDAVFVAIAVSAGRFGDQPYLLVSPRTPLNGLVIPSMGLSATVGGTDVSLEPALDPKIGFHYGANVDGLSADDDLELVVDTPPQSARHEGFETAFLDMPPMTF